MSKSKEALETGREYRVQYPFHKTKVSMYDSEVDSWTPGIRYDEFMNHYDEPDSEAVADGIGFQVLTVVSKHKPGNKYPIRVFHTQQWLAPDGTLFGKKNLRMITEHSFRTKLNGFRFEYKLKKDTAS